LYWRHLLWLPLLLLLRALFLPALLLLPGFWDVGAPYPGTSVADAGISISVHGRWVCRTV
jgi:hypothetical protein